MKKSALSILIIAAALMSLLCGCGKKRADKPVLDATWRQLKARWAQQVMKR